MHRLDRHEATGLAPWCVTKCQKNGESGHKWGESGKCYTGKNSKEKALEQGRAIEASKNKSKSMLQKVDDALNNIDEQ